jgi:metal-sulfur cluster biosynthetic enzyme
MKNFDEVVSKISEVYHPAINHSLIKLGIVQDIELLDDSVILTFVFPFPNIPIADNLISSVEKPIMEMGLSLEYIVRIMNDQERARFLQLEAEAWKGL